MLRMRQGTTSARVVNTNANLLAGCCILRKSVLWQAMLCSLRLTGMTGEQEQSSTTDARQQGRGEPGNDDHRHALHEEVRGGGRWEVGWMGHCQARSWSAARGPLECVALLRLHTAAGA